MMVFIPPLAECERDFDLWFIKLSKLAQELTIPMQVYCNKATEEAFRKLIKKLKISAMIMFLHFDNWEEFLVTFSRINQDDLIVLISSRSGSASHMSLLDNLPSKLEKQFSTNSRIVIFPQQDNKANLNDIYGDLSAEPINIGIETVQKIGKGIGHIFKKGDHIKESKH